MLIAHSIKKLLENMILKGQFKYKLNQIFKQVTYKIKLFVMCQ